MSGAEADVRVRVRPAVVAIGSEDASVRAIVPIAAAVEGPQQMDYSPCWFFWPLTVFSQPPSIRPISTTMSDQF